MARKAKPFSAAAEAAMLARMKAGGTVAEVAKAGSAAGGRPISTTAAHRWVAERRSPIRSTKARAAEAAQRAGKKSTPRPPVAPLPPASTPAVLSGIPEDPAALDAATPGELDWWLSEVKAAFEAAKNADNVAAQASLAARATALLEAKRKSAPPPVVDPNENPDFVALAKAFRTRMLKMLESPT